MKIDNRGLKAAQMGVIVALGGFLAHEAVAIMTYGEWFRLQPASKKVQQAKDDLQEAIKRLRTDRVEKMQGYILQILASDDKSVRRNMRRILQEADIELAKYKGLAGKIGEAMPIIEIFETLNNPQKKANAIELVKKAYGGSSKFGSDFDPEKNFLKGPQSADYRATLEKLSAFDDALAFLGDDAFEDERVDAMRERLKYAEKLQSVEKEAPAVKEVATQPEKEKQATIPVSPEAPKKQEIVQPEPAASPPSYKEAQLPEFKEPQKEDLPPPYQEVKKEESVQKKEEVQPAEQKIEPEVQQSVPEEKPEETKINELINKVDAQETAVKKLKIKVKEEENQKGFIGYLRGSETESQKKLQEAEKELSATKAERNQALKQKNEKKALMTEDEKRAFETQQAEERKRAEQMKREEEKKLIAYEAEKQRKASEEALRIQGLLIAREKEELAAQKAKIDAQLKADALARKRVQEEKEEFIQEIRERTTGSPFSGTTRAFTEMAARERKSGEKVQPELVSEAQKIKNQVALANCLMEGFFAMFAGQAASVSAWEIAKNLGTAFSNRKQIQGLITIWKNEGQSGETDQPVLTEDTAVVGAQLAKEYQKIINNPLLVRRKIRFIMEKVAEDIANNATIDEDYPLRQLLRNLVQGDMGMATLVVDAAYKGDWKRELGKKVAIALGLARADDFTYADFSKESGEYQETLKQFLSNHQEEFKFLDAQNLRVCIANQYMKRLFEALSVTPVGKTNEERLALLQTILDSKGTKDYNTFRRVLEAIQEHGVDKAYPVLDAQINALKQEQSTLSKIASGLYSLIPGKKATFFSFSDFKNKKYQQILSNLVRGNEFKFLGAERSEDTGAKTAVRTQEQIAKERADIAKKRALMQSYLKQQKVQQGSGLELLRKRVGAPPGSSSSTTE